MSGDKRSDNAPAVTFPKHLANLNPRGRASYLLSSIRNWGQDGSAKRFHSLKLANEFATWAPTVLKELLADNDGLLSELNDMEVALEEEKAMADKCTCSLGGDPDVTDPTGDTMEALLAELEEEE